MAKDKQARKWQLTFNNPLEKDLSHEKIKEILDTMKSVVYWCMSDEIGRQEKTYHTHLFLYSSSGIRFSTIKNRFPQAHIELAKGTAIENRNYVFKEGKWENNKKAETKIPDTQEEWGEIPIERQGARNDLADLYDMIKDGLSNCAIMEENPEHLMVLDRIEKARQTIREEEFRTIFRNLEVTYIWGSTGTGKTKGVMEKYGYTNVYRVTDYTHPFDAYQGEAVLLLDEYSSNFKIRELLNYLDGYPLTLPCRYTNRVACYTKVYIISNLCLSKQYLAEQSIDSLTFAALLRRIQKVVRYDGIGEFVEYTTADYIRSIYENERSE